MNITTKQSVAIASTLANIPQCEEIPGLKVGDEALYTTILVQNTALIPIITQAEEKLANPDSKKLFMDEVDRMKSELSLYASEYKKVYGKEYVPEGSELGAVQDTYSMVDASSTDSAYLGILRGALEYNQRQYYSFALQSDNLAIKENAEQFAVYKEKVVKKIEEINKAQNVIQQ